MEANNQISPPSQDAIDSVKELYSSIHAEFPTAVSIFEDRWAAAYDACRPQFASQCLDVDVCAKSDAVQSLIKLSPKIVPMIVYKLADDPKENAWGVLPYSALEKDPAYRSDTAKPSITKEELEHHAHKIVELNHQRNKIFEERVGIWKEFCLDHRASSATATFTETDEYDDLLEMGMSIIAPLMVEYHRVDGNGAWYELLHEICFGRKMGAHMVQRGVLCHQWFKFFNEGEHDEAPLYTPNAMDIYVKTGEVSPELAEYWKRRGLR